MRNRLTRSAARMSGKHVDRLVDTLQALPTAIGAAGTKPADGHWSTLTAYPIAAAPRKPSQVDRVYDVGH
nr:hypothetical protein [Micromonospora craterilacus]